MLLRHQLDSLSLDEVTDAHILAALLERIEEMHGYPHMDPAVFWTPETLGSYRAAAAWWPNDAPRIVALPLLSDLVFQVAGNTNRQELTAFQLLVSASQRCQEWLVSEGRDPANPNETKAEAQRRKAALAMRASRDLARAAATNPQAARVKELHGAYMAACKARKDALTATHAHHDPLVKTAMDAWHAAKAELSGSGVQAPSAEQE